MCGLVGMAGTLEYRHKNAMKEMLFLNTLRGRDSTGLTAVRRNKDVCTRKMTVPGYEFIEHPTVEKAMNLGDQLWMGHGRFRTTGDVSKSNAHPFEIIDEEGYVLLVGTHNGTLTNKFELERLIGGSQRFETDSEALFNWFMSAPNYKEAVKNLRGAWSLVWWDPTTDSLHFCRNEERPLVYAYTKDRKAVVWASEGWMIINACRRNGVELATNDKGFSCFATLPDNLYTLEIPQVKDRVLPDFKREGGYVGSPTRTFQTGGKKWNEWWGEEGEKKAAAGKKETTADGETKGGVVVDIGVRRGFEGKALSVDEFETILARGCGWCHDEINPNLIFAFLDEEYVVCSRCMRDFHPKDSKQVPEVYDDELDDDLFFPQKDTPEYRSLIEAATLGAQAVG